MSTKFAFYVNKWYNNIIKLKFIKPQRINSCGNKRKGEKNMRITANNLREMANENGFSLTDRQVEKILTKIDRSEYYDVRIINDPRELVKEMILEDTEESSFAGRTSSYCSKRETADLLFAGGYVKFGKFFKREHFEYSEKTKDELRLSYPKFSLKKIAAFSKCCEENRGDENSDYSDKENVIVIYVPFSFS